VWLVAGVWAVRSMAGSALGYSWGLACLGAGLRWGTFGLGDLEVATRLVDSTIAAGTTPVRVGMTAALVGALIGEAHVGGFRARPWGERAASAIAAAALVPIYIAPGPIDATWPAIAWRAPAAVAATAAILVLHPVAPRIPRVVPAALTAAGVLLALVAS
jgi:hypothetical protein